eukprot:758242-Hanusia_phi.AAC.4
MESCLLSLYSCHVLSDASRTHISRFLLSLEAQHSHDSHVPVSNKVHLLGRQLERSMMRSVGFNADVDDRRSSWHSTRPSVL